MTGSVRLMLVGVLLVLIVAPVLAHYAQEEEWERPGFVIAAAAVLLAGGVMIGYALGVGPD